MKLNLDSMCPEIQEYIESRGMVVFHCLSRWQDDEAVYWNLKTHPDYRSFVASAESAKIPMITMCATEFEAEVLDLAMERLKEAALPRDERRAIEKRLREMHAYTGFICEVELSFDLAQRIYVFNLRTPWFDDLNDLIDQIDDAFEEPDDEEPLHGYFSKN